MPVYAHSIFALHLNPPPLLHFFRISLPKPLLRSESGREHHKVKEGDPNCFFPTPAFFYYSLLPCCAQPDWSAILQAQQRMTNVTRARELCTDTEPPFLHFLPEFCHQRALLTEVQGVWVWPVTVWRPFIDLI